MTTADTLFRMAAAGAADGSGGAIWGAEAGQLNATVVRWPAGSGVAAHVNAEVDVVMAILGGEAVVTVDGAANALAAGDVLVIPRGAQRSVTCGAAGAVYVNVHQRRRLTVQGAVT